MTAPETVLARATARGGQYEAYIGGGVAQFTSAQVGHALAGFKRGEDEFEPLPEGAFRILLLRYAGGDHNDTDALIRCLLESGKAQMDWTERTARTVVCRCVVREFLSARRCGVCDGRQVVWHNNLMTPCEACGGSGYKPLSASLRARDLGLPVATFKNGPAERIYLGRYKRLVEWEEVGLRRVVAKTRSGRY